MEEMATHEERAAYLKTHPSWNALKSWLSGVSSGKCWYCEAKSLRSPLDVDHFRPKLKITIDGKVITNHRGYHWIAYEWSNFRLSCQRCNRPEADETTKVFGKANEFPLQDETTRCQSPNGLFDDERPKLLDPCVKEDCDLIVCGIDGEVKPSSQDKNWDYERARYTIKQLGLNAFGTPEAKRSHWQGLEILIKTAGDTPVVVDHLKKFLSKEHEYSKFFLCAVGSRRDKSWIEALLYQEDM